MRKFALERHQYSPEQNRIQFDNGATMRTPHCTSLKQVKEQYFKPASKGVFVIIKSVYDQPEHQWLSKVVGNGRVESRLFAVQYAKRFKQGSTVLFDGETLPANRLTFKFSFN